MGGIMGKALDIYKKRVALKKKVYEIAQKCRCNQGTEWSGYLRPDEILTLMESDTVSVDKFHEVYVERAKADKEKGLMNPVWFYFYPKKDFLKMKSLGKNRCY